LLSHCVVIHDNLTQKKQLCDSMINFCICILISHSKNSVQFARIATKQQSMYS